MVIFPIWKFPNGFIIDSPERIFSSTEKFCDVVYTHSHKLYIILETASEEGSLNDIIALKTKKIHISVDTVGVYSNICGRINCVSCFCQSLIQSSWLTIWDSLVENNNTNICLYFYFLINKDTLSMGTNYCELQKVVYAIIALHVKKRFNSWGQEPYLDTCKTQ